ncbi:DNA helicase II [Vibrio natriegens]|uniref:DNA helicase II n=1 Tax=Vibrio natriegens NBRC 15636 = ATCC 14048 = DSM 759 TaxID=1219067 RepID=A0AAN0Y457_VIBNA|nr:DNA helicase II [Vibrio natriegens]ALR16955.1 DNA-dependent helicase II [Vibrio natriegens NBRC 15636 = ATCC 14048 = DSM 759]ANQ13873.1 DNA helicase II [Vibrio natriegens NBRC 15636 = ATCC 14048 = DSM 759]EPM42093.1 DNA-dependent helicase [Vibrio natriegens NBRC 15636 = ATCC 14048 = DSM 759]MDX6025484.1 DNA helicase II [Vibrio natriegens NBRC 15636 = ATCC 14048 = DSM 759]UUI11612.1 DNA helicase II [Vibrio natriegens]
MMDPSLLLDGLNDKQREAVAAPLENLLVLAGAGSGKTRVLVHRIAWLMSVEQASPFSIMSVTFTNKAAAEMRGRIEELMMGSASGMWNGTFHGICHRILRAHYLDAKLPEDFQIIDSDDQQRLLKRLIKAQNLDEKQWPARQVAWWINGKKDEGLRPAHIDAYHDPVTKTYLQLYTAYQEACDRAGLVDFAEILLRAHELLRDNKFVREHYQARFKHILVDEFQDTNNIQYAWLRMMAGPECHVMIVGDDDQSIYGWRGAKVENIEKFTLEFPSVSTIRLEQNYRSTKTILEASNTLISNNTERMGKELWTDGVVGEPISVYSAYNELDEARFAVTKIKEWQDKGGVLNDAAMLYRNNAQSRVLEEALIQAGLPYRIYGGMRFFERQEIKDALSYLRLIANRNDDAAFERVVNTPTRGLGDKTLETIRRAARDRGCTMWEASIAMLDEQVLAGRAAGALSRFIELVTALEDDTLEKPLHEQTDHVIKYSGLFAMYEKEKGEKSKARIENLEELVTATRQFEKPEEAEEMSLLTAFLTHAALEAGEGQADEFEDAVQLMTLHSAKGLEFPLVFMVGVEEGMFPSQMSAEEAGRLEEERRLCYVGMTRAMQKLYITYAEMRRLYGQDKYHKPSRFIRELPEGCLDEVRMKAQVSRPASSGRFSQTTVKENFNETGFALGSRVMHPKFGEGTIINFEGSGPQSRVQIAFNGEGIKWLVTAYARLEKL